MISLEKFIAEIVRSAGFITATHNDFIGQSLADSHRHPDIYQVSYYLKGKECILVGKRRYTAREGDLFLIPPHCPHGSDPNARPTRFEMLQVKFTLKHALPRPLPVYTHVGFPSDLLLAFHSLVNEFHMQRPRRETMMRLDCARMIALIQRRSMSRETRCRLFSVKALKMVEQRLERVIHFLQANYMRELPLAEIAEKNGYGASTLSHLFKQHIGVSPVKYLINYRLSKALDMIGHTDKKLADIAQETGFKNVYYFSRLFKNRYNQSPRRYAREIYNM